MKRKFLFISTLIASLAFTIFVSCSNTAQKNSLQHDLKLIVTSDIHAGVDQNLTLPKIVEMRKELEKEGNYTLLIDDGDILQGGLLSSESEGEDLIDIINTAGYDILTPGNHDFDYGMDRFFSNTEKLNTPYISCNFTKNNELIFDPYVIKDFDGVKFADFTIINDISLVGAIRVDTAQYIHQGGFARAVFTDQCVDFPLFHLEIHIVQRLDARKRLCDILHFQQNLRHSIPPAFLPCRPQPAESMIRLEMPPFFVSLNDAGGLGPPAS